jgi:hypothetical protein
MIISKKLVTTYLMQAESPEAFKEKLINSMLSASPRERNYGIVLEHSFSADTATGYSTFTDEQRDAVDMLTRNIYPAAYAIYGREKSFISAYRKLSSYAEVTAMKDQFAQRLVLSDEVLETKDSVYFSFLILKNIIDFFQTEMKLLIHPVTERTDSKVPIQKDVRPSLYIPKELPIPMCEYEEFYKNYVMRPKKNGYQGLHFVARSVDGTSCEWQIWTTSMARRNDMGSASHDTHKPMDELDQACIERGPEFVKALLSPRIIGDVLMRDTAQEQFPRDLIIQ